MSFLPQISGAPTDSTPAETPPALPWWDGPLTVQLDDDTCRRSAEVLHAGSDALGLLIDGGAPVGARARITWTAADRGCHAAGRIIAADGDRIIVALDATLTGVQRRGGVRIADELPVRLRTTGGQTLTGTTRDLSLLGVRVIIPAGASARAADGEYLIAEIELSDGPLILRAQVVGEADEATGTRLRFLEVPAGEETRLGRHLAQVQRIIAARLSALR